MEKQCGLLIAQRKFCYNHQVTILVFEEKFLFFWDVLPNPSNKVEICANPNNSEGDHHGGDSAFERVSYLLPIKLAYPASQLYFFMSNITLNNLIMLHWISMNIYLFHTSIHLFKESSLQSFHLRQADSISCTWWGCSISL